MSDTATYRLVLQKLDIETGAAPEVIESVVGDNKHVAREGKKFLGVLSPPTHREKETAETETPNFVA